MRSEGGKKVKRGEVRGKERTDHVQSCRSSLRHNFMTCFMFLRITFTTTWTTLKGKKCRHDKDILKLNILKSGLNV